MHRTSLFAAALLSATTLTGCGPDPSPPPAPKPSPPKPIAAAAPGPLNASVVNTAQFGPTMRNDADRTPSLLRAQVLLDRARFSPGVIDGRMGDNVRQAVAAFQTSRNLTQSGDLDEATYRALTDGDGGPALKTYVITADDVAGPFQPVPDGMEEQSRLKSLGYASPAERLAEKFHMTEELLRTLNPGVNFGQAGASIQVAAVGDDALAKGQVKTIKVDKDERAVLAYDADGKLIAFYPASIGSAERPAPSGDWKVRGVAFHPTYTWDPSRLTFAAKGAKKKLTIAAGPNNPVGAVWIDLTRDTYGIHGTPDPKEIGKTFSHGCVRLTNWDAEELASGVKPGVEVDFTGSGRPTA